MGAIKIAVKSRSGRDILPDGILVPDNVRGGGRERGKVAAGHQSGLPGLAPATWLLRQARCRSPTTPSLPSPPQASVEDLKQRFAELKPRFYPSRQRFTLPPREGARSGEALADGKRLSDYGLGDGAVLYFKDLGPQVAYRAVFFWEYFGPLAVYPLFYFLPQLLYSVP